MILKSILAFLFLIFATSLEGQSITPFTVNIAGFTAQKSGYSITVSTGEAISITNFISPTGTSLNSGFLQNNPPIVTFINDVYAKIGPDEVRITPNPTKSITNVFTSFKQKGSLQYQILDVASKPLYRSQSLSYLNSRQTIIELYPFPAGVYYIQIFFKPLNGALKSGIYKIIKL
jgi:hypothetical protein